jgi:hypothetical protein
MLFDFLRQSNIFGNGMSSNTSSRNPYMDIYGDNTTRNPYGGLFQSDPITNSYQSVIPPIKAPNLLDILKQLYTPETTAQNRLNSLIDAYPERQNPSLLSKIAASLMGLGNSPNIPKLQDNFLYGGYNDSVADWKNKVEPAYQAANLERYGNANDRALAYQAAMSESAQRKLEETERNNRVKTDLSQGRLTLAEWKAHHPNAILYKPLGGNAYWMDPQTKEVFETEVSTGTMTEEGKLEKITEGQKAVVDERGRQARLTKDVLAAGRINASLSPNELKTQRYNRAHELAGKDPILGQFIEFTGTNEFTIQKTKSRGILSGSSGPSPAQRKAINDFIDGVGSKEGDLVINRPAHDKLGRPGIATSTDGGKTWSFKLTGVR